MKILVLALFALLLAGCGSDPERPASDVDLEIHLQTGFSETLVWVSVDGSEVFHGRVTTGAILAYAAIIPVHANGGMHHLLVLTGDRVLAETDFEAATPYVGVLYDASASQLSFHPSKERFPYR